MTKSFEPSSVPTNLLHQYLLSCVAPRPIAWASTIDNEGNINLAPFSFFNVFSSNPPILIFSPARRVRDNSTKHTLENVTDTKECVINIANYALKDQMAITSAEFDEGINEFKKAGLTMTESVIVKPPRVDEAPAAFECKVNEIISLGKHGGAGNLIICEVVYVHIKEFLFDENGKIDPRRVDNIARLGYNWYTRSSNGLFEMKNPKATPIMGFDNLPEHIVQSRYFTDNERAKLAASSYRPTREEIEMVKDSTGMREIYDRYQSNNSELKSKVHSLAKTLIGEGKIDEAWRVLLSFEEK